MKKVDSRLKGHPGAETAVLARALGLVGVLAAPAIPDMGRIQRGGLLSGEGIARPLEIAALFPGLDVLTPDIAASADFDAALAATDALPVGARGLAGALIRALWPEGQANPCLTPLGPARYLPAPALLVVGSRDPVTLAQVVRLRATRPMDWRAAPNGLLSDRAPLRSPLAMLQLTPGATQADPARVAADLACGALALIVAEPVATLIATGGETAQALMVALGADRITVTGMPLPGIAHGLIVRHGCTPLHLVTKSGGFGHVGSLVDLTALIGAAETAYGTPT
jgi:uncharacterized protein YgbK (DUF1537 family)